MSVVALLCHECRLAHFPDSVGRYLFFFARFCVLASNGDSATVGPFFGFTFSLVQCVIKIRVAAELLGIFASFSSGAGHLLNINYCDQQLNRCVVNVIFVEEAMQQL